MTDSLFEKRIDNITAHKVNRQKIANQIIENHVLFQRLIWLCFQTSNKNHYKACWILELVCYEKPEWMKEHLDYFCSQIKNLKEESAIRPIAKILHLLTNSHYKNEIQLSEKHLEAITENCFDWLINDIKVASKVYSMRTLYLLGKKYSWIHPELKTIITKDFPNHSAAYKAVSKEILKKIK